MLGVHGGSGLAAVFFYFSLYFFFHRAMCVHSVRGNHRSASYIDLPRQTRAICGGRDELEKAGLFDTPLLPLLNRPEAEPDRHLNAKKT